MAEETFSETPESQPEHNNAESASTSSATLNYLITGVIFLIVGILIGMFGLSAPSATIDKDMLRDVLIEVLEDPDLELNIAGAPAPDNNQERFALVDDDPYIGNEDAPIVIVEFSDYFCSFCKRHFDQTFTPLLENYGEYIRYVYRDFSQLTAESEPAAAAAECAHEQDKYWEFHGEFFQNQGELGYDFYIETAEKFDLDVEAYTACVDEGRYIEEVQFDLLDGRIEGVQGTPAFFINGEFVSGAQPYIIFERIVQRELEKQGIDLDSSGA